MQSQALVACMNQRNVSFGTAVVVEQSKVHKRLVLVAKQPSNKLVACQVGRLDIMAIRASSRTETAGNLTCFHASEPVGHASPHRR